MPQQINLFPQVVLAPKGYFQAQSMAMAVLVFMVAGGALLAYSVNRLNAASRDVTQLMTLQSADLEKMQALHAQSQSSGGDGDAAKLREVQSLKADLQGRERLLHELQDGLVLPGAGHAAKLMLIAQTIPAQAWITRTNFNDAHFDVSGLTLDPAALNDWVTQLAASPLLAGQRLARVSVEAASESVAKAAARPVWAFRLVSAQGDTPPREDAP